MRPPWSCGTMSQHYPDINKPIGNNPPCIRCGLPLVMIEYRESNWKPIWTVKKVIIEWP